RASITCVIGPTVAPTMAGSRVPRVVLVIDSSAPGEVHALDEDLLEVRVGGEGDVLDALGDLRGAGALGFRQERQLGAEGGGVADVADALVRQVGDEADTHRAGDRGGGGGG